MGRSRAPQVSLVLRDLGVAACAVPGFSNLPLTVIFGLRASGISLPPTHRHHFHSMHNNGEGLRCVGTNPIVSRDCGRVVTGAARRRRTAKSRGSVSPIGESEPSR